MRGLLMNTGNNTFNSLEDAMNWMVTNPGKRLILAQSVASEYVYFDRTFGFMYGNDLTAKDEPWYLVFRLWEEFRIEGV